MDSNKKWIRKRKGRYRSRHHLAIELRKYWGYSTPIFPCAIEDSTILLLTIQVPLLNYYLFVKHSILTSIDTFPRREAPLKETILASLYSHPLLSGPKDAPPLSHPTLRA